MFDGASVVEKSISQKLNYGYSGYIFLDILPDIVAKFRNTNAAYHYVEILSKRNNIKAALVTQAEINPVRYNPIGVAMVSKRILHATLLMHVVMKESLE